MRLLVLIDQHKSIAPKHVDKVINPSLLHPRVLFANVLEGYKTLWTLFLKQKFFAKVLEGYKTLWTLFLKLKLFAKNLEGYKTLWTHSVLETNLFQMTLNDLNSEPEMRFPGI